MAKSSQPKEDKKKNKNPPQAVKPPKKVESESESDSESEDSSSEEEIQTKTKPVTKAAPAKKQESSSESESDSGSSSEEEAPAKKPVAKAAKKQESSSESEDEKESEKAESSSESESESEAEEEEAKPTKRKAAADDQSAKRKKADESAAPSRVFVGGLPWSATDESLLEYANSLGLGEVLEANIITDRESGRSKGFGYISAASKEVADAFVATTDAEMDGRTLRFDHAGERPQKQDRQSFGERQGGRQSFGGESNAPGTTLMVRNLSWNVDNDTLQSHFEGATSCRVATDRDTGSSKGFGFVDFGSVEEAQEALKNFNGQEIDGRAISIDFAAPRGERSDRGGFGRGRGGDRGGRGGFRGGRGGSFSDRGGRGGFRGGRGGDRGGRGGFRGGYSGSKRTFDD